jgi:DnaJ-class molecular chaperone
MNRLQKTYKLENCAWCKAGGRWNLAPGHVISCVVCGGKGQVSVAQPSGKCRQCAGSGKRNPASPCLQCAGTGWEHISD